MKLSSFVVTSSVKLNTDLKSRGVINQVKEQYSMESLIADGSDGLIFGQLTSIDADQYLHISDEPGVSLGLSITNHFPARNYYLWLEFYLERWYGCRVLEGLPKEQIITADAEELIQWISSLTVSDIVLVNASELTEAIEDALTGSTIQHLPASALINIDEKLHRLISLDELISKLEIQQSRHRKFLVLMPFFGLICLLLMWLLSYQGSTDKSLEKELKSIQEQELTNQTINLVNHSIPVKDETDTNPEIHPKEPSPPEVSSALWLQYFMGQRGLWQELFLSPSAGTAIKNLHIAYVAPWTHLEVGSQKQVIPIKEIASSVFPKNLPSASCNEAIAHHNIAIEDNEFKMVIRAEQLELYQWMHIWQSCTLSWSGWLVGDLHMELEGDWKVIKFELSLVKQKEPSSTL